MRSSYSIIWTETLEVEEESGSGQMQGVERQIWQYTLGRNWTPSGKAGRFCSLCCLWPPWRTILAHSTYQLLQSSFVSNCHHLSIHWEAQQVTADVP